MDDATYLQRPPLVTSTGRASTTHIHTHTHNCGGFFFDLDL